MEDNYYDGGENGSIGMFRRQLQVSELDYATDKLGIDIEPRRRSEAYRDLLQAADARFRNTHFYGVANDDSKVGIRCSPLDSEVVGFLPEATDICVRVNCGAFILYKITLEKLRDCDDIAEQCLNDLPFSAQAALKGARDNIEAMCLTLEKYHNDILKAVKATMSDE